jgi:Domain of unknown function (DUF4062)
VVRERKYIVFVSATMVDLKSHRQKVIESIIRLQQIPFSMEYFPATPSALGFIDEQIKQSDIFLLLLGQSIGTKIAIGTEIDKKTFIQHEYELAKELEKDILVLTLSADMFKEQALKDFLELVSRSGNIISTFRTDIEAGNQAYYALSNLIKEKNEKSRGGWIEATPYDKVGGPFFDRYLVFFTSLEKFNLRTKRQNL